MRKVSGLFLATAVAFLCTVSTAHAQSSAEAEAFFREGKKLMAAGKIGEACDAFQASYESDAAVSTLLNLADCREKNNQFATAWGHFIEAMRLTRANTAQQSLFNTAKDRSLKLEGLLSYLIINVPDESRVDGLEITRNGVPVNQVNWNRDIPIDGGSYKIEGKAPGYEAWSTSVTVGKERDKQSVNVPRFSELPKKPIEVTPPDDTKDPRGPVDEPSGMTGKRKLALGVGGAGLAVAIVGTVFYVQGRGLHDDAGKAPTQAERDSLQDDANAKFLIAQIGWGVGAAAIGAAAYLWFTGGPTAGAERGVTFAPRVDASSAGFVVGGRF
jgi:hypothetical protein